MKTIKKHFVYVILICNVMDEWAGHYKGLAAFIDYMAYYKLVSVSKAARVGGLFSFCILQVTCYPYFHSLTVWCIRVKRNYTIWQKVWNKRHHPAYVGQQCS